MQETAVPYPNQIKSLSRFLNIFLFGVITLPIYKILTLNVKPSNLSTLWARARGPYNHPSYSNRAPRRIGSKNTFPFVELLCTPNYSSLLLLRP
jgi:hypothetical protein